VADSLPSSLISRSEEDLVKEMASDLTKGVNGSDVKCGVIGEIGCTWPLHGCMSCSSKLYNHYIVLVHAHTHTHTYILQLICIIR